MNDVKKFIAMILCVVVQKVWVVSQGITCGCAYLFFVVLFCFYWMWYCFGTIIWEYIYAKSIIMTKEMIMMN